MMCEHVRWLIKQRRSFDKQSNLYWKSLQNARDLVLKDNGEICAIYAALPLENRDTAVRAVKTLFLNLKI
jgi:hypothetical protein